MRMMKNILLTSLLLVLLGTTGESQVLQGIEPVPRDRLPALEKSIGSSQSDAQKVTALLQLGTIYYTAPYPHNANLHSAMRLAREAASLSSRSGLNGSYNEAQLLIAFIYLRENQIDSARSILPKVNDSTRLKLLLGIAEVYRDDDNEDRRTISEKAMRLILQAKEISQRLNDTLKKIMVSREIALIHANTQEPGAEAELLQVIQLLRGVRYPYLHYTYFELALLEYYLGNFDKALNYSQLGLQSMVQTKDSANAGDLFEIYGCTLRKAGQHEASAQYLKLSADQYRVQYGEEGLTDALYFLVEEMIKLHQPAECGKIITKTYSECTPDNSLDSLRWFQTFGTYYRLRKDYTKAQNYFQLRVNIQSRLGYQPDYYGLGQAYLEAGNYAKAKPYLEKALNSIIYTYNISAKAHLEYCLFLADSAAGNYISAIRHLSQNKLYDDSVMKQAKVDAVERYKTQFQTERKEADLKLKDQRIELLVKEQKLKDMYLERANFIRDTAIIGSLILLFFGILMNVQYRQKKKASAIIAKMNGQLQRSLAEKEWLLKEVNHRVKNNLHTIICLLESQAMYLEKDALQAIEKSQHRIYAMSLIHQKLYQNDDEQSIDMAVYLEEFIGYLKDSFDTQQIEFIVEVQPVRLNLQQAVSVALIVNEAVTNSIKYAFKNNGSSRIWITMSSAGEKVKLVIADNGRGFQLNEEAEGKSLGLQLIRGLSKELLGTVEIETTKGTRLVIEFTRQNIVDPIQQMQTPDYEA
jgi:two-component sensor histidine kinase